MAGTRLRRRLLVAMTALGGLLLSACSLGTNYTYLHDGKEGAYFKIPKSWHVFSEASVVKNSYKDLTSEERSALEKTSWRVGFDASTAPSIGHIGSIGPKPAGLAFVDRLTPNQSDTASTLFLRNLIVDVDTPINDDRADIIQYDMIQRDGGFHGIHMVIRIRAAPNTSALAQPASFTINQIALLDQKTERVYVLFVACTSECFSKNETSIKRVVDSWHVKRTNG
jgi:hypothetical protein